jgi:amino acid transporter
MRNPARELPRAMFFALGIVIVVYVLISAVIVMTLTLPAMDANQGHVLSEAAQQIVGRVGFVVIGVCRPAGNRLRRKRHDVRRRQSCLHGVEIG